MPLIKSISGIRGTIGNRKGEDLTKEDIVLYTRSFILWLENEKLIINNKVVVGREARKTVLLELPKLKNKYEADILSLIHI